MNYDCIACERVASSSFACRLFRSSNFSRYVPLPSQPFDRQRAFLTYEQWKEFTKWRNTCHPLFLSSTLLLRCFVLPRHEHDLACKFNLPPQPRFGTPHICTSYKSFINTAIYSHGATLIPRHFRFRFRCFCGATARFNSTITLFPSEDGANVDKFFYFLKEATRLKDKCTPTEIQRISHGRAAI
jgi:hypothetical protein